ncbi:MAG: hypothetical protein M1814_000050 [Vezdaea aestivalis]|nr:MAG: hypothetical protein M1814_000050 [Vezdaea aestivalis]
MAPKPNPRPKRPTASSDIQIPASLLNASSSSSKKRRFDARNPSALAPDQGEGADDDDDNLALGLDSLSGRNVGVKRGAVNLDGFESDSSNEGFDGRQEAKAKERREAERERREEAGNDDMFGGEEDDSGSDDKATGEGGGKPEKKAVRFLDEEEIGGQELDSKTGGHVSGDFTAEGRNGKGKGKAIARGSPSGSSASSRTSSRSPSPSKKGVAEEDVIEVGAGGSKKHAPTLDAFHMRSELNEGAFDDSGNYIRQAADPAAVHDSWLAGMDRKEVKKAAAAAEKRAEKERKEREKNDEMQLADILGAMILQLERGETVLEGLARLGKGKQKTKKVWKKKAKQPPKDDDDTMEVDTTANEPIVEEDPKEKTRREAVEAITEGASALLNLGQNDVYEAERELLVRWYRKETGDEWVEPRRQDREEDQNVERVHSTWEYRWSDGRADDQVHGPYDAATMKAWQDAGFFGEGVEFRSVNDDTEEGWSRLADFS